MTVACDKYVHENRTTNVLSNKLDKQTHPKDTKNFQKSNILCQTALKVCIYYIIFNCI